jgi:Domain of unknown function (DUF4331)
MKTSLTILTAVVSLAIVQAPAAQASSHMDAPLITRDPSANTTDVYAFVDQDNRSAADLASSGTQLPVGAKSLVVALAVYPHEEPGVGPNIYNFDDNVLYEIHVATGRNLAAGRATMSYQFEFTTTFKNKKTILDSYLGVINNIGDANQNLVQTYTVTKVTWHSKTVLGTGVVPPNNQGNATPFYNQNDDGNMPAKDGVPTRDLLDRYTNQAIAQLRKGYVAFAGQRDDGFYADINSIFDLLSLRNPGVDSQGGFNLHLMALSIPIDELGGDRQIVGVYATTSRKKVSVLRDDEDDRRGDDKRGSGPWVQVARQGNPLFNEGLVAIVDKDLYSRTSPTVDYQLFRKYALNPELAALINALVVPPLNPPAITTGRTDIAGIYIPDLIKVDLSTPGVRFAGSGPNSLTNPDDPGFSRLGIFGTPPDVLQSQIQDPFQNGGLIPGGWPNGRRFGDDVVDIAVTAIISDLRTLPLFIRVADGIDGVSANDIGFNKTFPYEGTPQNGRVHAHPDLSPTP